MSQQAKGAGTEKTTICTFACSPAKKEKKAFATYYVHFTRYGTSRSHLCARKTTECFGSSAFASPQGPFASPFILTDVTCMVPLANKVYGPPRILGSRGEYVYHGRGREPTVEGTLVTGGMTATGTDRRKSLLEKYIFKTYYMIVLYVVRHSVLILSQSQFCLNFASIFLLHSHHMPAE